MIMCDEEKDISIIDKIVTVCCAMCEINVNQLLVSSENEHSHIITTIKHYYSDKNQLFLCTPLHALPAVWTVPLPFWNICDPET